MMKFGKFSPQAFRDVCDDHRGWLIRGEQILRGRTPEELLQPGYQAPGWGARRIWRELRRGVIRRRREKTPKAGWYL